MSCYIQKDAPLYLGAGNRNGTIPTGHPELRSYLQLSMTPEFQHKNQALGQEMRDSF